MSPTTPPSSGSPAVAPSAVSYAIGKAPAGLVQPGNWFDERWRKVPELAVDQFHARGSDHRPITRAKLLHDEQAVYVFFRVQDRYVVSRNVGLHVMVCTDSCVEFFVRPKQDKGYLNFEINCGGSMLLYYITDHHRAPGGFAAFEKVPAELASQVKIYPSLPQSIEPEIDEAVEWTIQYAIPRTLLEHYVGPLGKFSGQQSRGNFFKCADNCSHPHWATWSPIREQLNFHLPEFFAPLTML